MKVTILESSRLMAVTGGGSSLMIHNTNAEGTDEPGKGSKTKIP